MGKKEVKGQRQRKGKVDPQLEWKSTAAKKISPPIEEVEDDMKLTANIWSTFYVLSAVIGVGVLS